MRYYLIDKVTELVVGERTVETHASNILSKLGLASRREVARWVAEHGPLV